MVDTQGCVTERGVAGARTFEHPAVSRSRDLRNAHLSASRPQVENNSSTCSAGPAIHRTLAIDRYRHDGEQRSAGSRR